MKPTPDTHPDLPASRSSTRVRAGGRGWGFSLAIVLAVFLGGLGLLRLTKTPTVPFTGDPRFVVTQAPTLGLPANASVVARVQLSVIKAIQRWQGPRPLSFTFPASPTNRCSIHGLLNQCTGVTGNRYVIAQEVAGGTVEFGHARALNGQQWADALKDALQHTQVEWWDAPSGAFRRESLLLVTNAPRTVLVIPRAMAAEFSAPREGH